MPDADDDADADAKNYNDDAGSNDGDEDRELHKFTAKWAKARSVLGHAGLTNDSFVDTAPGMTLGELVDLATARKQSLSDYFSEWMFDVFDSYLVEVLEVEEQNADFGIHYQELQLKNDVTVIALLELSIKLEDGDSEYDNIGEQVCKITVIGGAEERDLTLHYHEVITYFQIAAARMVEITYSYEACACNLWYALAQKILRMYEDKTAFTVEEVLSFASMNCLFEKATRILIEKKDIGSNPRCGDTRKRRNRRIVNNGKITRITFIVQSSHPYLTSKSSIHCQ
jgi:hypothetical protein